MSDFSGKIAEFLEQLIKQRRMSASLWPQEADPPELYGLSSEDGFVVLDPDLELLEASVIKTNLSAFASNWLRVLEVHRAIGSTNRHLMDRAQNETVDGWICLADLQTQGRGRRGRRWISPFGRNLAMSLGFAMNAGPGALGGLSLAIGLAAVDCLESMGVLDVRLKWPNDLLLEGGKLGGILLELVRTSEIEVVVGIGLNLELTETLQNEVDQVVADLVSHGYRLSRSELAGKLASSVVDYVQQFQRFGFAPMRPAFDERHYFQGKRCRVHTMHDEVEGVVTGVSDRGELTLQTPSGVRIFVSGEVSLRESN